VERFEYLIVRAGGDKVLLVSDKRDVSSKPEVHDYLNSLGREGWELVSVTESEVTQEGFSGLWGDSEYIQDLFLKRRVSG